MGTLIQIDSTGTHELGSGVQSADTAFGPSGQVLEVVSPDGTLTQIDASGPHVVLTGVQSADTVFGPAREVVEVVNTTRTLTQFDSTGSHVLLTGVQSADTAFGPFGQVLDVVNTGGTLTQLDGTGPHVLLTGVQSVDTAFGPSGEVVEVVNTGGTLTQLDSTGTHVVLTGVQSADTAFGPSGQVLEVVLTACFAGGTRVATPTGDVAMEELREGDLVATAAGDAKPIVWIGRSRVDCRRHAKAEDVIPVRIRAGAFAPGAPKRDLVLSPGHAVFLEGVLIPVKHLVNGVTIAREEGAGRVTYYHVELASHDVLLAEGLPVESYLDDGNRAAFESGGAYRMLHPKYEPTAGKMPAPRNARAGNSWRQ